MARLTENELKRKDAIDAVRTAARLAMRMKLRHILNEVENDLLEEFERRLAAGEPFELDIRSVLKQVTEELDS